jgi:hypothetical protein
MAERFLDRIDAEFEGLQEHLVVKVPEGFFAVGTLEIVVHGEREGKDELAVLADIEIILFLVPFPAGEFFQDEYHVIAYGIEDMVGPELPEIGKPARLVVLDAVVLGQPLLVERIESVPYRIQVDAGTCRKIFIAVLPFGREPLKEVEPVIPYQAVKIGTYCRIVDQIFS